MGATSKYSQGMYKEADISIERLVSKELKVSELNSVIQAYKHGGGSQEIVT